MVIILIAVFVDLVGFGLIVPILPFITTAYGGDALTGTALVSIYSLFAFLSGPLWGRLSDKIGRKPALMLTFLGGTLSYLTLAFSSSLVMLYVARAMSGAMAGNVGIVMATMADLTTEDNRGRAMGYIGAAFALGFAVGPGLAALLAGLSEGTSILLPGLGAATLSFSAMLLTAFFMPETSPNATDEQMGDSTGGNNSAKSRKPDWRDVVTTLPMALLMFMFVVLAVGQSVNFSITPFWLQAMHGWSEREVGFLMMGVGLLIAFVNIVLLGRLFSKFGEVGAMIIGAILFTIASIGMWFYGDSLAFVFIAFPMQMTGLTIAFPAMNSEVSKRTDAAIQGAALGLSNGLAALGRVAGPLAAGVLFTAQNPSLPFLVVTIVGIITLIWCVWDRKQQGRHATTDGA